MNRIIIAVATLLIVATSCSTGVSKQPQDLSSKADSISYAFGMMTGGQTIQIINQQFDNVDMKALAKSYENATINEQSKNNFISAFDTLNEDIFKAGLINSIAFPDENLAFATAEDAGGFLNSVYTEKQAEKDKLAAEGNKTIGNEFLADNSKRKEVKVTDSGLQYEIIKEGNGKVPTSTDKVKVNYRGTLIDGTEFDSSYKRNEPITFPVTGVIPGWTEALQMMPVGSKWKLYIPSELAYGDKAAGQLIKPGSTLIFEIELLGIEK